MRTCYGYSECGYCQCGEIQTQLRKPRKNIPFPHARFKHGRRGYVLKREKHFNARNRKFFSPGINYRGNFIFFPPDRILSRILRRWIGVKFYFFPSNNPSLHMFDKVCFCRRVITTYFESHISLELFIVYLIIFLKIFQSFYASLRENRPILKKFP